MSSTTTDVETTTTMPSGLSALIQAAEKARHEMMMMDDPVPELVSPQSQAQQPPSSSFSDLDGNGSVGGAGQFLLQSPSSVDEEELVEQTRNTFPGILMSLALDPQNHDTIAFLPDGKYFCMRMKRFALELMTLHFGTGGDGVHSIEEFLDLAHDWGFRQVLHDPIAPAPETDNGNSSRSPSRNSSSRSSSTSEADIQVFRHPLFIKGDWRRCAAIQKFGDDEAFGGGGGGGRHRRRHSSASVFMPIHAGSTVVEDVPSTTHKRQQCNINSSTSPRPKHRKRLSLSIEEEGLLFALQNPSAPRSTEGNNTNKGSSIDSDEDVQEEMALQRRQQQQQSRRDSIRSVAMSLTSEQLDLLDKPPNAIHSTTGESGATQANVTPSPPQSSATSGVDPPLVDQAVKSATHTIVTDAIETLLHDEMHTIVTYVKHEKELSRSSLPGVIPMSKQLFEPSLHSSSSSSPPPPQHTSAVDKMLSSSSQLGSKGNIQEEDDRS